MASLQFSLLSPHSGSKFLGGTVGQYSGKAYENEINTFIVNFHFSIFIFFVYLLACLI